MRLTLKANYILTKKTDFTAILRKKQQFVCKTGNYKMMYKTEPEVFSRIFPGFQGRNFYTSLQAYQKCNIH